MAGDQKRIDQLDAAGPLANANVLAIVQSAISKSVTLQNLVAFFNANLSIGNGAVGFAQLAADAVDGAKVKDHGVALIKLPQIGALSLLVNPTGLTGDVQAIPLGPGFSYSGGQIIFTSPNIMPRGYRSGGRLANDTTTPLTDFTVAPAGWRSDDDTVDLKTTVSILKRVDATFAEYSSPSSRSGALDSTANLVGTKFLYVFLIGGAGKNTQPFVSTGLTPALPTGFTAKRYIGAMYWDGSKIAPFTQFDKTFMYLTPVATFNSTVGTGDTTIPLQVPAAQKVRAFIHGIVGSTTGNIHALTLRDPDEVGITPTTSGSTLCTMYAWNSGQYDDGLQLTVIAKNGGALARANLASTPFQVVTRGWEDNFDI